MKQHVRQLVYFTAALGISVAVACGDDDEPSGPQVVQTNFSATLSGANERPNPVTTNATGNATFTLFDDDSVTWRVQVANIDSVTASHIHGGDANTAGGILFGFPPTTPIRSFTTLTTLHEGTITRASTFNVATFTFDSLMARMRNNTLYVNVHTRRFGGGEIRGQIVRQ